MIDPFLFLLRLIAVVFSEGDRPSCQRHAERAARVRRGFSGRATLPRFRQLLSDLRRAG